MKLTLGDTVLATLLLAEALTTQSEDLERIADVLLDGSREATPECGLSLDVAMLTADLPREETRQLLDAFVAAGFAIRANVYPAVNRRDRHPRWYPTQRLRALGALELIEA
jgi:hypothetical protein